MGSVQRIAAICAEVALRFEHSVDVLPRHVGQNVVGRREDIAAACPQILYGVVNAFADVFNPVSYTHLTLPTTPYV